MVCKKSSSKLIGYKFNLAMKPVNAEFVRQLEEVTKYLEFGSESDSCFKPFVWEVNERGTLTLEKLLQSEGFLSYVKANGSCSRSIG